MTKSPCTILDIGLGRQELKWRTAYGSSYKLAFIKLQVLSICTRRSKKTDCMKHMV